MRLKEWRPRNIVLLSFAVLLAVLCTAAASMWWYVFHTSAGTNYVVQKVSRLKTVRIVLTEVSGNLAGPLTIRHFELDEDHVHISAENIRLELTPLALFALTVRASQVNAEQVIVKIKEFKDTPPTKPLRFLPGFLHISVGNAVIVNPKLVTASNTVVEGSLAQGGLFMNSQSIDVRHASVETAQYSASGQVKVSAMRPVGLDIVGAIHIPAARDVTISAEADLHGNAERLRVTGKLLAPALADIEGDLFRGKTRWEIAGNVRSERFGLEPWLRHPPFSLQTIALQISGEPTNFKVRGMATVPEVDRKPLNVSGQVQYASHVLSVIDAVVNPVDTDMTTSTTLHVALGGTRPQIDATSKWTNLRWPVREPIVYSANGNATFAGALPYAIAIKADVDMPAVTKANVEAHGSLLADALAVDNYKLMTLQGNVQGKARWNFTLPVTWELRALANNLNPQALHRGWFEDFPGRLTFTAQASGVGTDKKAELNIFVNSLSGTLRNEKIMGRGGFKRTIDSWAAKDLSLAWGANRLSLNGSLSEHSDLTWSADVPAVERFVDNAAGELHTHGAIHGKRAAPQGSAVITGKRLRYGDWHATTLNVDTNIDLAEGHGSKLLLNSTEVGWRELLLDELHISSDGSAAKHTIGLQGTLSPRPIAGAPKQVQPSMPQHLSMTISGQYARNSWRGLVSALRLEDANGNAPTVDAPAANAIIAKDNAHLTRWCALWRDRKLCASGSWRQQGDWQAAVDSDELSLGIFDGTFPRSARYQGTWKVRGQIAGHRQAPWTGDANVQVSDATLAYQPIAGAEETVQLGSGHIDANATTNSLATTARITTPGTTSLAVNARIVRNMQVPFTRSPLNGDLTAHTADANLLPLFFPDLDRSAGELNASLRVRGSLATPQVQGEIVLARGELDLYRYNLSLRDIGLLARIDDNRVDFKGGAHAGTGTFDVNGQLAWNDAQPRGRLQLQGKDLLVADLPDYRVTASPDLIFAIEGKRIDMSGEILIPSAHIQPTDVRGAVQRSPDARLTAQKLEDQRGFEVYSEVRIAMGDDVRLDTYGLQGQLRGAVTTISHPNEVPRGRGELSVSDGRYEAYGQKLAIERGRLLFDASPLDDPGLDILAARDIESQKVGVNVRGTLRAPRMTLYADPPLAQGQIVSYLFTGKPLDDLRNRDTAAIGNASNELALQGGGLLASQIGRRVGLEAVSVESNGLNDASLVLGKFLSPRVFVSYGISLTESINTLKLRYTISNHWLFKTEAGQYQSGDLEFRIER